MAVSARRDPNEHSTEEIIRSYHEHQGEIDMRPFWWKLLAAVTTVGSGGSAALEGPSIYGGGAIGSWLWTRLRRFGLEPRDRRIMLISGAAAGMAAVFRAPLTGTRVRARDAVQGRPRARGAAAVADRVGGGVRNAGRDRRLASRCSDSAAAPLFARPICCGRRCWALIMRAGRDGLRHHVSASAHALRSTRRFRIR